MKILLRFGIAILVILGLIGCGGGGSSSSSGSAQTALFITDDLNTGYDHVWVTIYQVQVVSSGSTTTLFDSNAGVQVDLRSLNSGTNSLFKFLGAQSVPSTPISKIEVQLDRSLTLFATGASTGLRATFDTALNTGTNRSKIEVTPTSPVVLTPGSNLALDFDLANWTIAGTVVTPVVALHAGAGLDDPSRQIENELRGTVSNLSGTGVNTTFNLQTANSGTIAVKSASDVAIFYGNGAASPTLVNGATVEIKGIYSTSTRSFTARRIKIENESVSGESKVKGSVQNVNSGSGTFEVKSEFVRGFLPQELYVQVQTSTSTRFYNRYGAVITQSEFFAGLGTGKAEIEGTYNSGSNLFTATKAKLEEGTGDNGTYQEARGIVTASSSTAGTLTLNLTEWEGFPGSFGQSVEVTTDGSTSYRNGSGATVTKAEFFSAVTVGTNVKAEGIITGNVMVAKSLRIVASGGGGLEDPAEIRGYISDIDAGARTFSVTLVNWSGFSGIPGSTINVTMTDSATYRNDQGETITANQFFAALATAGSVEVEGSVSGSAMSGVHAKLDD